MKASLRGVPMPTFSPRARGRYVCNQCPGLGVLSARQIKGVRHPKEPQRMRPRQAKAPIPLLRVELLSHESYSNRSSCVGPRCGRPITAYRSDHGHVVECGHCGAEMRVSIAKLRGLVRWRR